ncbi:MAG: hypothetical protein AB8F74_05770 [Saprospiraceae bacterium]
MKKILQLCFFLSLIIFIGTVTSSCSKKTGCPMNESVHNKPGKKGKMKTKKGKSNLFPKNMRGK